MSDPSDLFAVSARLEGVPSAVRAARDGIDAVLRDRGLRRSTPEDTARSLLLGAAASAGLAGEGVDPDVLASGGGGPVARGALRVSGELLGLLRQWRHSPVQAIARLHALAAADSVPAEQLGRPVDADGVARLQDLARRLAAGTAAPGLVVAAVVHAEIVAAAAFESHNDVVARAAERLVLVESGVDPASVTIPEAGHAAQAGAYHALLDDYRSSSTQEALHAWLLHAATAYTRGAELSPLAPRS